MWVAAVCSEANLSVQGKNTQWVVSARSSMNLVGSMDTETSSLLIMSIKDAQLTVLQWLVDKSSHQPSPLVMLARVDGRGSTATRTEPQTVLVWFRKS